MYCPKNRLYKTQCTNKKWKNKCKRYFKNHSKHQWNKATNHCKSYNPWNANKRKNIGEARCMVRGVNEAILMKMLMVNAALHTQKSQTWMFLPIMQWHCRTSCYHGNTTHSEFYSAIDEEQRYNEVKHRWTKIGKKTQHGRVARCEMVYLHTLHYLDHNMPVYKHIIIHQLP